MKKSNLLLSALIVCGLLLIQSCKDDPAPTFSVGPSTIDQVNYSAGGTLVILYSIDGGKTFASTVPTGLANGTILKAKLTNGTADLSKVDFSFDWSATTPAPTSPTSSSDVVEISISGTDISIKVTVADLYSLVSSNRTTGKFFSINPIDGTTTEAFTPTYLGATLNEVRAVVYHPKKNLYYLSQNAYTLDNNTQLGYLYSMTHSTKVTTRINENNAVNGVKWDAVVNWAVAADDSLISVGDFNNDGNGVVKFGTDGKRSKKTVQANSICCGLGMLYDSKTNKFTLSTDGGFRNRIFIQDLNASTGVLSNDKNIVTFTGFPEDFSISSNLSLKAMARNGSTATIYGLLYNGISSSRKTYFIKLDLTLLTATYISTIGADNNNQYNNLTWVPNHTF